MRYFQYSPELQRMMKKAVHFPWKHLDDRTKYEPIVVAQQIGGHAVEAVGTMIERNGRDGYCLTSCVRWRVDGRWVNKAKLLVQFGVEI